MVGIEYLIARSYSYHYQRFNKRSGGKWLLHYLLGHGRTWVFSRYLILVNLETNFV